MVHVDQDASDQHGYRIAPAVRARDHEPAQRQRQRGVIARAWHVGQPKSRASAAARSSTGSTSSAGPAGSLKTQRETPAASYSSTSLASTREPKTVTGRRPRPADSVDSQNAVIRSLSGWSPRSGWGIHSS